MSSQSLPVLHWKSFPLLDYGIKSLFLVLLIIGIPLSVYGAGFGVNWSLFAFVLLFGSMFPYFFSTEYHIFDEEILIIYAGFVKIRNPLSKYRCFYSDRLGMQLGTMARPTRLDRFRGISLRFSRQQTEKKALEHLFQEKGLKAY